MKKGYRRFALKYHPDKTQNRTGILFTAIQASTRAAASAAFLDPLCQLGRSSSYQSGWKAHLSHCRCVFCNHLSLLARFLRAPAFA